MVMSKKSKSASTTTKVKPRNPVSLNPLMKKSHVHSKSTKAERAKEKQALKKALRERDLGGKD